MRVDVRGGSSPRVRGKPGRPRSCPPLCGLIPACAGKTRLMGFQGLRRRAHPRVRGENLLERRGQLPRQGSSPRVRGKHRSGHQRHLGGGLIPACAGKTASHRASPGRRPAHPRVCGENETTVCFAVVHRGSSPRVRGKPCDAAPARRDLGLIPACAGKTLSPDTPDSMVAAHPRVCGENFARTPARESYSGSSPRVRGKHDRGGGEAQGLRLIPACAGKTGARPRKRGCWSAHPRVCGENGGRVLTHTTPIGSSPRVRGKRGPSPHPHHPHRLIPACAGKTRASGAGRMPPPAHPRVCGENAAVLLACWSYGGSSPRVRGKPHRRPLRPRRPRLIPACAGKTSTASWTAAPPPAHPRVCGENNPVARHAEGRPGSSPRVRGKHSKPLRNVKCGRLIPACAGKTRTRIGRPSPRPAHPRVCGENALRALAYRSATGSSPRVRGKLRQDASEGVVQRLIPACAGKTRPRWRRGPGPAAHPRVCGENWRAPT